MTSKICLYLAITNIWIIYRVIFKKDYSNDISQCKNPIILVLRYLLTITIGMPAFYLLILFSFITGFGFALSINIHKRAIQLDKIIRNDKYQHKEFNDIPSKYWAEIAILLIEAKIIEKILFINRYILKALSTIRKKLIV